MQPGELGPPPVDADTAAATVADVLSRPEYAELEPGLLDRVVGALMEGFGRLMAAFTGTPVGSVAGWLVLAVLIALVAVLVLRGVRSLRPDAGPARQATPGEVGRSPEAWLVEAEEHEAAARWRQGVRCRYRALVAALAGAGRLEEVPGRTAGEYLGALRASSPEAGTPFTEATRVFERAWYGSDEVDADDASAMTSAADATLDAAGARRAEARR